MPIMFAALDTSRFEMSPLSDDAKANIPVISVTLDTPHCKMSPLNDCSHLPRQIDRNSIAHVGNARHVPFRDTTSPK